MKEEQSYSLFLVLSWDSKATSVTENTTSFLLLVKADFCMSVVLSSAARVFAPRYAHRLSFMRTTKLSFFFPSTLSKPISGNQVKSTLELQIPLPPNKFIPVQTSSQLISCSEEPQKRLYCRIKSLREKVAVPWRA